MFDVYNKIETSKYSIIDASGKIMDITGCVDLNLSIMGSTLKQNFKVLNSKTYNNVILGRDFMSKFPSVEFNFAKHEIKLGKTCI